MKLYEDDFVLSFLDISQVTEGHALVVPKKHCENLYDLDDESASKLLSASQKVALALRKTFGLDGLHLINNNGRLAGQSVFHFHIHLIPRYESDAFVVSFPRNKPDFEKLSATRLKILDNFD